MNHSKVRPRWRSKSPHGQGLPVKEISYQRARAVTYHAIVKDSVQPSRRWPRCDKREKSHKERAKENGGLKESRTGLRRGSLIEPIKFLTRLKGLQDSTPGLAESTRKAEE